jgi:hypothetical protein
VKFTILSNVENGLLKRNKNLLVDAIHSFEGKPVTITIERTRKKRSNPQNNFYWGVVLPIVQNGLKDATGEFRTTENIHYNILLKLFSPEREIVNTQTGESLFEKISSSEMSTSQFMDYIAEIQKWSAEFLGVDIPNPNEEMMLNFEDLNHE